LNELYPPLPSTEFETKFFFQVVAITCPGSIFGVEVQTIVLRQSLELDSSKDYIGGYGVATYEAEI
jgi:hypothetical protein